MATLTLKDLPDELHEWLKQQAAQHHQSLNKEIIAALQDFRKQNPAQRPKPSVEEILDIGRQYSSLPVMDKRSAEDIIGYNENGLPE